MRNSSKENNVSYKKSLKRIFIEVFSLITFLCVLIFGVCTVTLRIASVTVCIVPPFWIEFQPCAPNRSRETVLKMLIDETALPGGWQQINPPETVQEDSPMFGFGDSYGHVSTRFADEQNNFLGNKTGLVMQDIEQYWAIKYAENYTRLLINNYQEDEFEQYGETPKEYKSPYHFANISFLTCKESNWECTRCNPIRINHDYICYSVANYDEFVVETSMSFRNNPNVLTLQQIENILAAVDTRMHYYLTENTQ